MKRCKDWAKSISQELGIEYSDVLNMSVFEVNKRQEEKFMAKVMENRNNGDRIRMFQLLMNDYDYYYNKLGEELLMAFSYRDEDDVFEWSDKKKDGIDYDDPEIKKLLIREKPDNNYYYSYQKTIRCMKGFSYITGIIDDAICMKYPSLVKYNPNIYGYSGEWKSAPVTFTIRRNEVKENGYSNDDIFRCNLESLLNGDTEVMLEDYLEDCGFMRCKSGEDDNFKITNEFMSSPEMIRFFKDIQETFGKAAAK